MILKREVIRNFSKSVSSGGVFILSAVRTPIGLINGVLKDFSASQLGSFAIKEALQRALVPMKDLENVFLGCVSQKDCQEEILRRTGLSKNTKITVSVSGMETLVTVNKFLQENNNKVVIAGGMESFTGSPVDCQFFETGSISNPKYILEDFKENGLIHLNNYVEEHYKFVKASKKGAYANEVFKINFRKKGQHISVQEDEIFINPEGNSVLKSSFMPCDEALALVIASKDYCEDNELVPLAEIISFYEGPSDAVDLSSVIEKVLKLAKCQQADVARWEIFSIKDLINFMSCFDVDLCQVNKNGCFPDFGHSVGTSGLKSVCHLSHSLSPGEVGCVAGSHHNGIKSAQLIKKLGGCKSNKPHLTLYTKYPCPLCDELKEKLKPFERQFTLSEVDIEAKGNETYKELYRYEIPVLFFNGIFLCKHELNIQDFENRILEFENQVG